MLKARHATQVDVPSTQHRACSALHPSRVVRENNNAVFVRVHMREISWCNHSSGPTCIATPAKRSEIRTMWPPSIDSDQSCVRISRHIASPQNCPDREGASAAGSCQPRHSPYTPWWPVQHYHVVQIAEYGQSSGCCHPHQPT